MIKCDKCNREIKLDFIGLYKEMIGILLASKGKASLEDELKIGDLSKYRVVMRFPLISSAYKDKIVYLCDDCLAELDVEIAKVQFNFLYTEAEKNKETD